VRRIASLLAAGGLLAAAPAPAAAQATTANGRTLQPAGRQTALGNFPTGGALSPDGRFYWAVDSGDGRNDVKIVDVGSGGVVETLPLPGGYGGAAFAPDGRTAYVGGEPNGKTIAPEGPTKGDAGNVIHVFAVDAATGHATERDPIALPDARTGSAERTGGTTTWPERLAVSRDGHYLLAALNQADRAAIVDLRSGDVKTVAVGAYPYGAAIAPDSATGYVTNEYDGTVSVVDLAAARVTRTIGGLGGGLGDRNSHPEGIVVDPARPRAYVAVANRDLVAVLDTRAGKVERLIDVGRPEGLGTSPVGAAESPDGRRLYVADAGEDAVAVIALPGASASRAVRVWRAPPVATIARYRQLAAHAHGRRRVRLRRLLRARPARACDGPARASVRRYVRAVLRALRHRGRGRAFRAALRRARAKLPPVRGCQAGAPGAYDLVGRVPTAAYPTDVAVTPDGARLIWLAGKGLGSGPNPLYQFGTFGATKPYGQYVIDALVGRAGVLRVPSDAQARAMAAVTDRVVRPAGSAQAPPSSPVVGPDGGASRQIKHVFYIVRENRTYDQIFGSDPRGDGAPGLELFDDNHAVNGKAAGVTPNAHALAARFGLLDHVFADSEVSVDGHIITSGAYATDYVQKGTAANYGGRGRVLDFGILPVTLPPRDFIFDQATRQGLSSRIYGEIEGGNLPTANDGRDTYAASAAATVAAYPNVLGVAACLTLTSCVRDASSAPRGPAIVGAQPSRVDVFRSDFDRELAVGSVPALNYLVLPNDHTLAASSNAVDPRAMVADNDLALGQIVDAITHSAIWSESAIFVVEDDTQDGPDHVDAHRMPAFVISPWSERGGVVSQRYDQLSVLRTIELILGLKPLSLFDALAAPMYGAFGATPDVAPYDAVAPDQDLNAVNPGGTASARMSDHLPFDHLDAVPQEISDELLWKAVYGEHSRPPLPGPDASAAEHARAGPALRALRAGRRPRLASDG
jgi:YVTN family beta-propeller protein